MSRKWLWAVGCAVVGAAFEGAYATPTTHIWSPSTDVQSYGKWHLTADFYVPTERDGQGNRPAPVTNTGLTVGILPFEKLNAEVGFDLIGGFGELDSNPLYFNAKVGIPEGVYGKAFPALAVGVFGVGTNADQTDFDIVYGKAAKTVALQDFNVGRFSLGYFSGNPDLLTHNGKKDNDGILVAWERTMTEISDKLWVAVDYQGSQSSFGALNFGFSWKFADNVSAIFGYDIYNDRDLANTYTVQVDIDF